MSESSDDSDEENYVPNKRHCGGIPKTELPPVPMATENRQALLVEEMTIESLSKKVWFLPLKGYSKLSKQMDTLVYLLRAEFQIYGEFVLVKDFLIKVMVLGLDEEEQDYYNNKRSAIFRNKDGELMGGDEYAVNRKKVMNKVSKYWRELDQRMAEAYGEQKAAKKRKAKEDKDPQEEALGKLVKKELLNVFMAKIMKLKTEEDVEGLVMDFEEFCRTIISK